MLSASCAACPCPAPPFRREPPRTDLPVVCPGFGLDSFPRTVYMIFVCCSYSAPRCLWYVSDLIATIVSYAAKGCCLSTRKHFAHTCQLCGSRKHLFSSKLEFTTGGTVPGSVRLRAGRSRARQFGMQTGHFAQETTIHIAIHGI